jgi:hypothetical protein
MLFVNPAELGDDIIRGNEWRDHSMTGRSETSGARVSSVPSGSLLLEKVYKYSNPLAARYYAALDSPDRMWGRETTPKAVKAAPLPRGTGADSTTLFCESIGHSTPGTLDGCEIWGYWARYGQYLAYLEFIDAPLTQAEFATLAGRFDATITSRLR